MKRDTKTLLILAGGRGARFGGDKGLSEFEGTPMVKIAIDALGPLADDIVVAVAPGKSKEYSEILAGSAVMVEDSRAHEGPLLGLRDALARVSGDILMLSACDMPYTNSSLYEMLLDRLDAKDAAMPTIGGYNEPIMGVYRLPALRKAVVKATSKGEVKLSKMLDDLDFLSISKEEMIGAGIDPVVFTNLNKPLADGRRLHANPSRTHPD